MRDFETLKASKPLSDKGLGSGGEVKKVDNRTPACSKGFRILWKSIYYKKGGESAVAIRDDDLDRIIEIDNQVLSEKKSPLSSLVAEMDGKVVGFIWLFFNFLMPWDSKEGIWSTLNLRLRIDQLNSFDSPEIPDIPL